MRIKGSATHITASGHLHARTEQDQGEKEANTSNMNTNTTEEASSLTVCSLLLPQPQSTPQYFRSASMPRITELNWEKQKKKCTVVTHRSSRSSYQICISLQRCPGSSKKISQKPDTSSHSVSWLNQVQHEVHCNTKFTVTKWYSILKFFNYQVEMTMTQTSSISLIIT